MTRDATKDSRAAGRHFALALVRVWVALVVLAVCGTGCSRVPEGVRQLDRAELSLGDAPAPPDGTGTPGAEASGARWEPVGLPDVWRLPRRVQATRGWYRMPLSLAEVPAEPWIVLLPRAYPNAEVWVNGESLGAGGRMDDPVARNRMQPLSFLVPASLWNVGPNWIHVRFAGTPGSRGTLHPVLVGPANRLGPLRARADVSVAVAQLAAGLALVLGLVLLRPSGLPRPEAAGFVWLGAGLLGLAATSVSLFAPELPVPSRLLEWAVGSITHWTVLFLAIGVRRACGEAPARTERALMLLYAAATAAYALVPALWAGPVWIVWGAGSLSIMLRAFARIVGTAFETRRPGWAMASVVFALWLGGFLLSLLGNTDADRLTLGTAVLGVGGFLWSRTGTALRDTIALNRLLEERVAAREAELAANYARVRELEHARVVAGERERMTRDMHDGTGGLLVAALALARRQADRSREGKELTHLLEDAVEDLRLALASLRPQQGDLPSVLGLLRERLGRQARHHEMSLEWGVSDAGEGRPLDGEHSLQVIRVVQEAVTNALRHSGGTRVAVATRSTENGAIVIDVSDDGHGGIDAAESGRGIAHMRARAARLGAQLDVASGPGGTRVSLVLDPPSGR